MHPHTRNLADFYTQSAQKRHHTRRRDWPEFAHIATYINNLDEVSLSIIELGCGDGRLYAYLIEHCPSKILHYIGVDVSQGLIDMAHKSYPDAVRICDEMNAYIETIPQQSCDLVIAIASIQHLPTHEQQTLFFHEAYRVLNYQGAIIMTNWSLSHWFIKRYWKNIVVSIGKSIITLGYYDRRNLLIPFTDDTVTHYRFYHIFNAERLRRLITLAGFVLIQSSYSTNNGSLSQQRSHSRNHFHIACKKITA